MRIKTTNVFLEQQLLKQRYKIIAISIVSKLVNLTKINAN